MSTDVLLVFGGIIGILVALVVVILVVGRRRRSRQPGPGVEVPRPAEKLAIIKARNQARRLPAIALLTEIVKRGQLPALLEQADVAREVSAEDVARMKLLTMVLFGGLGALLGGILQGPLLIVLFGVGGLAIGFRGPDATIKHGAEVRQNKLSRALPLALEVIGLSVERTSIDTGIAYYCRYFPQEVLAEELGYVVERVQQLKERLDVAMGEMLRKNRNDDLAFLVAAVGQASQVGGRDLRQMLAQQAGEIRIKRAQEIKARSLRAPTLMTFPTMINVLALLMVLGSLAFLQVGAGARH